MKCTFARVLLVMVLGISLGSVGCKDEDSSSGLDVEKSVSKVQAPVFEGITLDDLKAKLGPDYKVEQQGPPTVFVKNSGEHRVALIVMHNPSGKLEGISLHIIGAQGSDDQMDALYKEAAVSVAQALGIPTDDRFSQNLNLGVVRTRMGATYNFPAGSVFLDLMPNNPLMNTWRWVAFQPNQVKRDMYIVPQSNKRRTDRRPIEGATLEQLTELLEGFELAAKIDGEQLMFTRQMEDHRQAVFCSLDSAGNITHIEVRVAAADDVDLAQKARQLWPLFAKLVYDECDPERVEAFHTDNLGGASLTEVQEVGRALFLVPTANDGSRNALIICGAEPKAENK